jgi:long-subunit acyl-CoA synthetase (AMP-forming)
VRVKSAFAADRYFGEDDRPAGPFRDGWFYPGDAGALSAEGLLVIARRS